MKRCGRCCIEKEEIQFGKCKSRKDGLANRCKLCKSIEHKEYILKYPEKFKEKYSFSLPKWREENKEKLKEYSKKDRERKKTNSRKKPMSLDEINYLKEIGKENQIEWKNLSVERKKEWKKEYRNRPDVRLKDKARKMMQYAVRIDVLNRPSQCSKCHIECLPDGHHEDYNKPLEVTWLCKVCHNKKHGKLLDV